MHYSQQGILLTWYSIIFTARVPCSTCYYPRNIAMQCGTLYPNHMTNIIIIYTLLFHLSLFLKLLETQCFKV
jgi:hypothetical protein